jgi:hypothetical protein
VVLTRHHRRRTARTFGDFRVVERRDNVVLSQGAGFVDGLKVPNIPAYPSG